MNNQSPTAGGDDQYSASRHEGAFEAPIDGTTRTAVGSPRDGDVVGQAEEEDDAAEEDDDFEEDDDDEEEDSDDADDTDEEAS